MLEQQFEAVASHIVVTVQDDGGLSGSDTLQVFVSNQAPTLTVDTVVPTQEGVVTIPSISYTYFDPIDAQYETASTDPA